MADRSVRVFLRAEVADFKRQIASAAEVTEKMSAAFDKSGQKIQTTAGRMVRSAEVNREAWTTVGTGLTAVSAATIGLGVAALNTGISYNTLRQTSTAALTTLLGSTQAAADQMDRLDDFATNSPFARQVFIQAQQQMLGFGVAAEDVLPALDAIQNAVAAMGGSNDQIAAIAEIMARIRSESRLSGDALQRLGYYGIDAATLIGDRMGLTAAEIRDMARKPGGIPVEQVWDPLVQGMQDKFGGAADNVKQTYEGALDRVRAAWRDLAADLAEPLVSAEGGGILVDLTNKVADLMRAYQALPEPVKAAHVALAGTASVAGLAAGGFLLLFPRVMDTITAMRRLQRINPAVASGLGKFAKGGAIVLAATAGLQAISDGLSSLTVNRLGIEETTEALLKLIDGADIAKTSLATVTDYSNWDAFWSGGRSITSIAEAFDEVARSTEGLGSAQVWISDTLRITGAVNGSLVQSREAVEGIDAALAQFVKNGESEKATQAIAALGISAAQVSELLPAYREALSGAANEKRRAADESRKLQEEQAAEAAATERLTHVEESLTTAQEKATAARVAYRDALEDWRASIESAFTSFVNDAGAYDAVVKRNIENAQAHADKVNQANAEWARKQDGDVKVATKTWEDYYDGVSVSAQSYIKELQEQVTAQQDWASNLLGVSDRLAEQYSGKELQDAQVRLAQLANEGPASAGVIQTLAGANDKELAEIVRLWSDGGTDAAQEFVRRFEEHMDPVMRVRIDMDSADRALQYWASQKQIVLSASIETTSHTTGRSLGPTSATAMWTGGPITGPGTSTSDSIPIMASTGEYMQNAKAHSFWGTKAMDAMNRRDVTGLWRELGARGFKDGGSIAAPAPHVVTVPVTQTYESHAPVTVHAYGADLPAMEAEAERRRINDLGGR